ncbi:NGG1p interacting factor 3 [Mollisia scopiformis]|uniref:NGG1p interacting factor 3 n=1 Tax=Mollisia scopiformis TaxID=149040 RepID=A0A194X3S6_MOLSC|nr:NGG1p interacting factor 3 [Mollisia scopiformis]KUJ14821.1 NGG1p interacting factor 3 [Mollisia scopiformis]
MAHRYPEKLADSSFDNTGLLLEAPYRPHLNNSVLLTVDLTKAVADEAIARKDSIIIAYHPIIFRPLKSFTLANTQQNSLLRLAQEGISVYSPHTAVDAAVGGLNDWLADIVTCKDYENPSEGQEPQTTRSVITPVKDPLQGFEQAGYGRIVKYQTPVELGTIVQRIMRGLKIQDGMSVATPQAVPAGQKSQIKISSIGICAGSGGSLLNGLDVDLLFTGELSHHEALAAIEQGKCVVTVFHSNSERGFLNQRMAVDLMIAINHSQSDGEFADIPKNWSQTGGIAVSQADRDPYSVFSKTVLDGGQW